MKSRRATSSPATLPASPYLTMSEAAVYLRYSGDRAKDKARQFLQRSGVTLVRRGRDYLVRRDSVDLFLETGVGDIDRAARAAVRQMSRQSKS